MEGKRLTLFAPISADEMQAAWIVTGVTMALFVGLWVVPGLREHAGRLRFYLLVFYLLAWGLFVAYVVLR